MSDESRPLDKPPGRKGGRRRKPAELLNGQAHPQLAQETALPEAGPRGAPPRIGSSRGAGERTSKMPAPPPVLTATGLSREDANHPVTKPQIEAETEYRLIHEADEDKRRELWLQRVEYYTAVVKTNGDTSHVVFDAPARAVFLAALEEFGTFLAAADVVGINVQTSYNLRKRDAEFATLCELALERHRKHLVAEARRRAVEGWLEPVYQKGEFVGYVRKFSDRLMEVMLRAHGGAEFKEKTVVEQTGTLTLRPGMPADSNPQEVRDSMEEAMRDPQKRAAMRLLLGGGAYDGSPTEAPELAPGGVVIPAEGVERGSE